MPPAPSSAGYSIGCWSEAPAQPAPPPVVSIGTRVELFVDNWLVDPARTRGVALRLQTPVRREVVLTTDKPWEGPSSAYLTVFQDGPRVRLYYRGHVPPGLDTSDEQVTCYAESSDGISFTRPSLGLHEFQRPTDNNIVFMGVEAHNFAPFLDTNPAAKADERYKAVGGLGAKLFAFGSPDGTHWKKMRPAPVMTKDAFDSLNVAYWDEQAKGYRCYSRRWSGGGYRGFRAVQGSTSGDFLNWTPPVTNRYLASEAPNRRPNTSTPMRRRRVRAPRTSPWRFRCALCPTGRGPAPSPTPGCPMACS